MQRLQRCQIMTAWPLIWIAASNLNWEGTVGDELTFSDEVPERLFPDG